MDRIYITADTLDPLEALSQFHQSYLSSATNIGATTTFTGTMRDFNEDDDVTAMELEHYPIMAEQQLESIVNEAKNRWSLLHTLLIHRVGPLQPADPIVLVAIWSSHRSDAFNAARFIMDQLKSTAPFWKKETLKNGSTRWVEKNTEDKTD